jgi:fimbrial chaperone protein
MMKKVLFFIVAACVSVTQCWASFSVETTRLVFEESNKSEQVTVANKGSKNYLVQSWIEDVEGRHTMDYLVVPPLFKIKPESKQAIQIVRNSGQPSDRENLYWINIKFLEPSSKDAKNVLRYSVVNRIKLIHRPKDLEEVQIAEEVKKLKISANGKQLSVENPTPVYINLNNIFLNGKEINNPGYIEPRGAVNIDVETVPGADSVIRLNYINDFGVSLDEEFSL